MDNEADFKPLTIEARREELKFAERQLKKYNAVEGKDYKWVEKPFNLWQIYIPKKTTNYNNIKAVKEAKNGAKELLQNLESV